MTKAKKLFAWDFHGTLEEGTEIGFARILKQLSKDFGINREIEIAEVKKLFGQSIKNYLRHFFPEIKNSTVF